MAKPGSEAGMAMQIFGPGAIREEHMTACAELPPLTEDPAELKVAHEKVMEDFKELDADDLKEQKKRLLKKVETSMSKVLIMRFKVSVQPPRPSNPLPILSSCG